MDEGCDGGRADADDDAPGPVSTSVERAAVRWGLPGTGVAALQGGREALTSRPARRGAGFATRMLSLGRRPRRPRLTVVAPVPGRVVDPETAAHEAR